MKTINEYLTETDKLFEEKFGEFLKSFHEVYGKKTVNPLNITLEIVLKSFLHQRQVGLIELIKGMVPEESDFIIKAVGSGYDWSDKKERKLAEQSEKENQKYVKGIRDFREQLLKNLEICRTTTLPAVSPLKD